MGSFWLQKPPISLLMTLCTMGGVRLAGWTPPQVLQKLQRGCTWLMWRCPSKPGGVVRKCPRCAFTSVGQLSGSYSGGHCRGAKDWARRAGKFLWTPGVQLAGRKKVLVGPPEIEAPKKCFRTASNRTDCFILNSKP